MRNEENLICNKSLQDKYISHYEVLEKVKELFLIPGTEFMTAHQIADYYEVDIETIQKLYQRNINELRIDGVVLNNLQSFLSGQDVQLENLKGKTIIHYSSGCELAVPNRGLKVFPRRAILRVGMLLRDSEVAREIRTQLLNIEEKATPEVKTQDINEEQKLALELGMAIASGNVEAITIASGKMMAFKNRHILKLETDNKALAGEILEWADRSKLNAGVRKLAAITGIHFSKIWNELYKNLQYKHSICLKQRGETPYIQWIKESEWNNVIQTFCAMCEAYEQSPSDMFQQTTPKVACNV